MKKKHCFNSFKRVTGILVIFLLVFATFSGELKVNAAEITVNNITELNNAVTDVGKDKATEHVIVIGSSFEINKQINNIKGQIRFKANHAVTLTVTNIGRFVVDAEGSLTIGENITISQASTGTSHPLYVKGGTLTLEKCIIESKSTSSSVYLINCTQDYDTSVYSYGATISSSTGRTIYSATTAGFFMFHDTTIINTINSYALYRGTYLLTGNTTYTGTKTSDAAIYDLRNLHVVSNPQPTSYPPGTPITLTTSNTLLGNAANTKIYYTTDGSDPSASATAQLYQAVIPGFSQDQTIRAALRLTIGSKTYSGNVVDTFDYKIEDTGVIGDIQSILPLNDLSVKYGAAIAQLNLPQTCVATVAGQSVVLPVEWVTTNYSETLEGTVTLLGTPVLRGGITNSQNKKASIVIHVNANSISNYINNPYKNINWSTVNQVKAALHNHTEYSNGSGDNCSDSPTQRIGTYKNKSYGAIAFCDHNFVTYPWSIYGASEEGMIAIPGNELSKSTHMLSYFNSYRDGDSDSNSYSAGFEPNIVNVAAQNGIMYIAHPNRSGGSTADPQKDIALLTKYPHIKGIEVINAGQFTNNYSEDLWDTILTAMMPTRNVWGTASDDAHSSGAAGTGWTYLLLENEQMNTEGARNAMTNGMMYFSSYRVVPGQDDNKKDPGIPAPIVKNVVVDSNVGTISVTVENATTIEWISSGGTLVATGNTINVNDTPNVSKYVRVRMYGPGGQTMLQPFGLSEDPFADDEEDQTPIEPPVTSYIKGDVDGNFEVNAKDVILLNKYLKESETLTDTQKLAADLNGDSIVTDADLKLLASIILLGKTPTTDAPVISAFTNHEYNSKANRYVVTNVTGGQFIASYTGKTNWDSIAASVSKYSNQYTKLVMTVKLNGVKQIGVDVSVPGKANQTIRYADSPLTSGMTNNGDGTYTMTMNLSANTVIKNNGISGILLYFDPEESFGGSRSIIISDMKFEGDGQTQPGTSLEDDTPADANWLAASSYACYYGNSTNLSKLKNFDVTIIDAASLGGTQSIAQLKAAGVYVIAYLTIGEEDTSNTSGKNWYIYKNGSPWKNPDWDSYYVDAGNPAWQDKIIADAGALLSMGADGIFMDTIDTIDVAPETTAGMISLVRRLHQTYPNAYLVANRGFDVMKEISPYISGVMFECFSSHYSNKKYSLYTGDDFAYTEEMADMLSCYAALYDFNVFSLDYAARNTNQNTMDYLRDRSLAFRFIPYISTINLDEMF